MCDRVRFVLGPQCQLIPTGGLLHHSSSDPAEMHDDSLDLACVQKYKLFGDDLAARFSVSVYALHIHDYVRFASLS